MATPNTFTLEEARAAKAKALAVLGSSAAEGNP
jgi:hypothetical protein